MKISASQLSSFVSSIGKNSFSCLLYGPDYGVKADISNEIEAAFLQQEFAKNIINIDFSSPAALNTMFSQILNYDLLPTKKIVKVRSISNKLTESIQVLINKYEQLNKDTFLILIADELDSKSSLRLLYESNNLLAAIPCYADTAEVSERLVTTLLNKYKIEFDQEVPKFIASCFNEDRMALKNEIDKISLNIDPGQKLTTEICQKIIDTSLTYTPDMFLDSIGLGDFKTALNELDKAFKEGNSAIGIVRFIVYHFLKLKEIMTNIKEGSTIDQEITKSRIFFKRIPSYKKQLSCLTANQVNLVLEKLLNIETQIKQYNEETGILILKYSIIQL